MIKKKKRTALFLAEEVFLRLAILSSNLMLNMDLSHQNLIYFTNMYDELITVISQVLGSLQTGSIVYCMSRCKNTYLPKNVCAL